MIIATSTLIDMIHKRAERLNRYVDEARNGWGDRGSRAETVLSANWNEIKVPKLVSDYLESEGVDFAWSDEIAICGQGKAWQMVPTHYDWQAEAVYDQYGELLTSDDEDHHWIDWAENEPTRCLPRWCERRAEPTLYALGYVPLVTGQEYGWHPGMTDDPLKLAAEVALRDRYADVVMVLEESSQFYTVWGAWWRSSGEQGQEIKERIEQAVEAFLASLETNKEHG